MHTLVASIRADSADSLAEALADLAQQVREANGVPIGQAGGVRRGAYEFTYGLEHIVTPNQPSGFWAELDAAIAKQRAERAERTRCAIVTA